MLNGPFVDGNFSVHMGPGKNTTYNPRCLTRDIAPAFAASKLNQAQVDWVLQASDYFEFDVRVEGTIYNDGQSYHGGGHLGVGGDIGEVGDIYSSPGDPLFFMHHANMDRLWNKWQRASWSARKDDIAGPDTQFAYPFDFFGAVSYQNVTLDYTMDFDNLLPDREYLKIRDVMDIKGGICATTTSSCFFALFSSNPRGSSFIDLWSPIDPRRSHFLILVDPFILPTYRSIEVGETGRLGNNKQPCPGTPS